MTQSKNLSVRKHSAGDAVVDGLLRGIVAGLAMAAVLVFAELLQGQPPGSTLSRFGLNGPATPIAGLLGHLAVAAVYGGVWGFVWLVVRRWLPLPAWLGGLIYSLVLFALGQVLLRAAGSPLLEISTLSLVLAHVVYGLVLGLLTR